MEAVIKTAALVFCHLMPPNSECLNDSKRNDSHSFNGVQSVNDNGANLSSKILTLTPVASSINLSQSSLVMPIINECK